MLDRYSEVVFEGVPMVEFKVKGAQISGGGLNPKVWKKHMKDHLPLFRLHHPELTNWLKEGPGCAVQVLVKPYKGVPNSTARMCRPPRHRLCRRPHRLQRRHPRRRLHHHPPRRRCIRRRRYVGAVTFALGRALSRAGIRAIASAIARAVARADLRAVARADGRAVYRFVVSAERDPNRDLNRDRGAHVTADLDAVRGPYLADDRGADHGADLELERALLGADGVSLTVDRTPPTCRCRIM